MTRTVSRGIAVILTGLVTAAMLAAGPATAGKFLTKKRALKLFYTKGAADTRFVRDVVADHGPGTLTPSSGATTTTNTVTIESPAGGVLVIQGSTTVDSDFPASAQFTLQYLVDGGTPVAAADAFIDGSSNVDRWQLAFHDGVAVGPGTHSVQMRIAGADPNYLYKLANLVVTLAPDGAVT